jgi:hypothetical protein
VSGSDSNMNPILAEDFVEELFSLLKSRHGIKGHEILAQRK